jgi:hypothetical protein
LSRAFINACMAPELGLTTHGEQRVVMIVNDREGWLVLETEHA